CCNACLASNCPAPCLRLAGLMTSRRSPTWLDHPARGRTATSPATVPSSSAATQRWPRWSGLAQLATVAAVRSSLMKVRSSSDRSRRNRSTAPSRSVVSSSTCMQLSRFAPALQDLDEFGYRRLGGSAAEDQPDVPGAEHELFFVRQAHQPENRPGGGRRH